MTQFPVQILGMIFNQRLPLGEKKKQTISNVNVSIMTALCRSAAVSIELPCWWSWRAPVRESSVNWQAKALCKLIALSGRSGKGEAIDRSHRAAEVPWSSESSYFHRKCRLDIRCHGEASFGGHLERCSMAREGPDDLDRFYVPPASLSVSAVGVAFLLFHASMCHQLPTDVSPAEPLTTTIQPGL